MSDFYSDVRSIYGFKRVHSVASYLLFYIFIRIVDKKAKHKLSFVPGKIPRISACTK